MRELRPVDIRKLLISCGVTRDQLILEIGSNEGDDTCKFLGAMQSCKMHCFECDPRAIKKWKKNIKDPRAVLYEVALADTDGVTSFHQSDGKPPGQNWSGYGSHWDKSGSLLPNDKHTVHSTWMNFLPPIQVYTTTLDNWYKSHLPPDRVIDFIWIDVQGAEVMVFKSGQVALAKTRFVYAEIDPRPNYKGQASKQEVIEALSGFECLGEYAGFNFLFKNKSL